MASCGAIFLSSTLTRDASAAFSVVSFVDCAFNAFEAIKLVELNVCLGRAFTNSAALVEIVSEECVQM